MFDRVFNLLLVFFIFSFSIFSLSGCATGYNPATGKKEYIFIDTKDEIAIGNQMRREINKKFRVDEDAVLQAKIDAIGKAVSSASDRQDVPYEFMVLKGKEVNAFTTPGGCVYVFRGLIDKTGSDSELASVIAHEIGHVAARHAAKKMEADMGYSLLMSIAFSKNPNPELERYVDMGVNVVFLGYSREDELFADKLAVRYLIKSGYNPYGMVSFMEKIDKMEKEDGTIPIYFLRSHPYMSQRIKEAEKEIFAELHAPQ
ncbi:MAG: M48 family metallopeptidase [Candidatus Omnitrophica bacterium]|nr:M48 family metallopeptidase [Candidatus Omnitrophota bacterium]